MEPQQQQYNSNNNNDNIQQNDQNQNQLSQQPTINIQNQQFNNDDYNNDQDQDYNFYDQQQPIYQLNQTSSKQKQYIIQEQNLILKSSNSNQKNNQQQMLNIYKIVIKQIKTIQDLICLNNQWSTLYYYLCGWNMKLVQQYIDVNNTYKEILAFQGQHKKNIMEFQNVGFSQCYICSQEGQILKNLCGHVFCINCWKGQISHRMKQYLDPFPPCLHQNCKIRTSPKISQFIGKLDQQFYSLYKKTICRSYAQLSKKVKICFGLDCNNCFFIKNPFEIAQCKKCFNFICLRCGLQHHYPAQCYDTPTWNVLRQKAIDFIQQYNLRTCPQCKYLIQRKGGCSNMKCRCLNQFCFICGENWVPNHQVHGKCYRQMQVRQLQIQRKRRLSNKKQFRQIMFTIRDQDDRLKCVLERIKQIKLSELKQKIVKFCQIFQSDLYFLENLIKVCRLGYMYQRYGLINYFMQPNLLKKETVNNLKNPCDQIYDFLLVFLIELLASLKYKNNQPQLQSFISKAENLEQYKNNIKRIQEYRANPVQHFMKQKQKVIKSINQIEKFLQLNRK